MLVPQCPLNNLYSGKEVIGPGECLEVKGEGLQLMSKENMNLKGAVLHLSLIIIITLHHHSTLNLNWHNYVSNVAGKN